jgi:hypothetical protein
MNPSVTARAIRFRCPTPKLRAGQELISARLSRRCYEPYRDVVSVTQMYLSSVETEVWCVGARETSQRQMGMKPFLAFCVYGVKHTSATSQLGFQQLESMLLQLQ